MVFILQNQFNWTMTYSVHSDIHLPYGKIVLRQGGAWRSRDYHAIANNKTKDAVWIVSHCKTSSKRENYVDILRKYISIDILGACGKRWACGRAHDHFSGNCFDILNSTYRYYIAFENAICDEYITEKFFENYNYDIIQVVRGGNPNMRPIDTKRDAYISASDFKTAHELGRYLKTLSRDTNRYASMLKAKDEYQAVPYTELFKNAACDICMRLHNQEKYTSVYGDINKWMKTSEPCFKLNDI